MSPPLMLSRGVMIWKMTSKVLNQRLIDSPPVWVNIIQTLFLHCDILSHNCKIVEKKSRDVEELMTKLVVCETERRERKTVSEEVFSVFC